MTHHSIDYDPALVAQVRRDLTCARATRAFSLTARLARWMDRRDQRLALAELDDTRLADIGLEPRQQRAEIAKWPWQA